MLSHTIGAHAVHLLANCSFPAHSGICLSCVSKTWCNIFAALEISRRGVSKKMWEAAEGCVWAASFYSNVFHFICMRRKLFANTRPRYRYREMCTKMEGNQICCNKLSTSRPKGEGMSGMGGWGWWCCRAREVCRITWAPFYLFGALIPKVWKICSGISN